jgi:hypothetical protein
VILPVILESRSDIRDTVPLCINALREKRGIPAMDSENKLIDTYIFT